MPEAEQGMKVARIMSLCRLAGECFGSHHKSFLLKRVACGGGYRQIHCSRANQLWHWCRRGVYAELCVRLVVNRAKDVVIGVKRRIDLLAVAVFDGWSLQKIMDLDMAQDGGMSNIFDPLKEAAMRAQKATEQQSPPLSAQTVE